MKYLSLALVALLALPVPAQAETIQSIKLQTAATARAVEATSSLVVAEDPTRTYLFIQNLGTNPIFLKPDGPVLSSTATDSIRLGAGGAYEPTWSPVNSFYVRSVSGSGTNDIVIYAGRGPRRVR